MPLYVFNRVADQTIRYEKNELDGGRKPSMRQLELKDEMDILDFSPSKQDTPPEIGLFKWFHTSFSENLLHTPESLEYENTKIELAAFLNSEITGPYYVLEDAYNAHSVLKITLFEPEDIKKFSAHFPKWEAQAGAIESNIEMLKKRQAHDWKPINSRLQKFAMK